MNNLMIFEGNDVEVFEFEGKILFNPRHVGMCLEMSDSTIRDHLRNMNENKRVKLKNSNVGLTNFRKLHNTGEVFITESGVYDLIFKSRKQDAIKFKDWVTDEVLPSIRKHGAYMTDSVVDAIYNDPQVMIDLLTKLKQEKEARVEAERKNAILTHVSKLYTSTEIAKELGFKSAVALNKDLHSKKIQYQSNGTWVLYSQYSDMALTSIKQTVLDNGKVVYDRKWTQEGREFLLNLYNEEV